MERFDKSIQYFVEYESHNRLNNVEVPKDATGLSISYAEDMEKLEAHIGTKIRSAVKKILDYELQVLENASKKAFLDDVFKMTDQSDLQTREYLMDLAKSYELRWTHQTEDRISKIMEVIQDKFITVLSPLYTVGDRVLHLIGFKCYIEDDELKVEEFKVNRVVLDKLLLRNTGYGLEEFLGGYEASQEYFKGLHDLSFSTFKEAFGALIKTLTEGFSEIEKALQSEYDSLMLISLEEVSELYYPPFKDDMKLLMKRDDRYDAHVLVKYIMHNDVSEPASQIQLQSHYGSYTDTFAVNDKQWRVVCGAHQSDCLSVSGPPGTGKTTLLKEIIADLSVKRTRRILNVWDKSWKPWKLNKRGMYESPFCGRNRESVLVTSTNNEAVNNIGVDISDDIAKLKSELGLQLSSAYSAKLGNKGNRVDFFRSDLSLLIDQLESAEQVDPKVLAEKIQAFEQGILKMDQVNEDIEAFLSQRMILERENLLLFDGQSLSADDMQRRIESLKCKIKEVKRKVKLELEKALSVYRDINLKIDLQTDYQKDLDTLAEYIEKTKSELAVFEKYRQSKLLSGLMGMLDHFGVLGRRLNVKCFGDRDKIRTDIAYSEKELSKLRERIGEVESNISELKKYHKSIEKRIDDFGGEETKCLDVIKVYEAFLEAYSRLDGIIDEKSLCATENLEYGLYNCTGLVNLRYKLFTLSLFINEAYIIKNKAAIRNNISLFLNDEGKVIQALYRSNYTYEGKTEQGIRDVWESFCLCYPVVTTTLHSYSRDNFHMLRNLFDYTLVDEAGQILPYFLTAPLYRTRNVVVVGDEKQLEPIRDPKNNVFEKYADVVSDTLDVNKTTAQGLANLATDFYEENSSAETLEFEGIMLEEHRRCEDSIVQFSNKYVYDGRMKIVKEDRKKPYLGDNVCFIDIRGVKAKNHVNLSEAKAVAALVNKLKTYYNTSDIAVIAPYKNQVNAIQTAVNDPGVKVGTVHSFQGKDKEVVIMSMTISSASDSFAKRFIGGKPNMLNVAFTRSKQQLFIVGNLNVLENSERQNFLYKASGFAKDHGTIFSIYESEYMEGLTTVQYEAFLDLMNQIDPGEDSKFEKIFRPYLNDVNIIEDSRHYQLLQSLFETAEKSVAVVSPWVTSAVVKDEFIDNIRSFQASKRDYSVVFGYKKSGKTIETGEDLKHVISKDNQFAKMGNNLEREYKQLSSLKNVLGTKLIYRPPLHTKALIVDREYLLIGSHNWLSKQGQRKNDREEMTVVIKDQGMIQYLCEKYGVH